MPTGVMNFAAGTRFTAAKHRAQDSPFKLSTPWEDKDREIEALLTARGAG